MIQAQTNQTNTNLSLKKLKGIKPVGVKVKPEDKGKASQLISMFDLMLEKYEFRLVEDYHNKDFEVKKNIYDELKNDFFQDFDFSDSVLQEFILRVDSENLSRRGERILGSYSGCLLEFLTEKNKLTGKRTRVYINGIGKKFNYLFWRAKHIDELIVDNFEGRDICARIAEYDGSANAVIVCNSIGGNILDYVGHGRAKVGLVASINNIVKGSDCGGVGSDGSQTGLIALINNKGNATSETAGAGTSNLGSILCLNSSYSEKDHPIAQNAGISISRYQSAFILFTYLNSRGYPLGSNGYSLPKVRPTLLSYPKLRGFQAQNNKDDKDTYKKIINLGNSMKSKTGLEIKEILKEILKIYNPLFQKSALTFKNSCYEKVGDSYLFEKKKDCQVIPSPEQVNDVINHYNKMQELFTEPNQ